MTPEQIIAERVAAHRQRVQSELAAELECEDEEEQRIEQIASSWKQIQKYPRWSNSTKRLVRTIDRLNRMARNPGYSV